MKWSRLRNRRAWWKIKPWTPNRCLPQKIKKVTRRGIKESFRPQPRITPWIPPWNRPSHRRGGHSNRSIWGVPSPPDCRDRFRLRQTSSSRRENSRLWRGRETSSSLPSFPRTASRAPPSSVRRLVIQSLPRWIKQQRWPKQISVTSSKQSKIQPMVRSSSTWWKLRASARKTRPTGRTLRKALRTMCISKVARDTKGTISPSKSHVASSVA